MSSVSYLDPHLYNVYDYEYSADNPAYQFSDLYYYDYEDYDYEY